MNSYEAYWLRAQRADLAAALHKAFGGWVCHMPADDPEWLDYADCIIAQMTGDHE